MLLHLGPRSPLFVANLKAALAASSGDVALVPQSSSSQVVHRSDRRRPPLLVAGNQVIRVRLDSRRSRPPRSKITARVQVGPVARTVLMASS
ncbi:MAG: hypothetical protein MUF54_19375, partial [Polyangiaceae bacterium]|nr:hypothetical protein [Polyangiaceae bacterium]